MLALIGLLLVVLLVMGLLKRGRENFDDRGETVLEVVNEKGEVIPDNFVYLGKANDYFRINDKRGRWTVVDKMDSGRTLLGKSDLSNAQLELVSKERAKILVVPLSQELPVDLSEYTALDGTCGDNCVNPARPCIPPPYRPVYGPNTWISEPGNQDFSRGTGKGAEWKKTGGHGKIVDVGNKHIYAVERGTEEQNLPIWVCDQPCEDNKWRPVVGTAYELAHDEQGLWTIGNDKNIYRTPDVGSGSPGWAQIGERGRRVMLNGGYVYIINSDPADGHIYYCKRPCEDKAWKRIPNIQPQELVVDNDKYFYLAKDLVNIIGGSVKPDGSFGPGELIKNFFNEKKQISRLSIDSNYLYALDKNNDINRCPRPVSKDSKWETMKGKAQYLSSRY